MPFRLPHLIVAAVLAAGETVSAAKGVPEFDLRTSLPELGGAAKPSRFIKAVGERSGIWGFENGRLEAWVYPLKVFRDFHLTFQLEGSPEVHEGPSVVRSVRVQPHMVELLYATEQFRVSQILFAPRDEPGVVMLLRVHAPATMRIQARFRPELNLMWPAGIGGQGSSWNSGKRWIRLSETAGRFSALIGSPAAGGSNAVGYRPYLTDAQPYDVLDLSVSPEETKDSYIPIVVTAGIRGQFDDAGTYTRIMASIPGLYRAAARHYVNLEEGGASFVTPDLQVNQSLRWARFSLEQLKVCNPDVGCSYVSGYGSSGTGTRPMYAWYFDEPVIAAWSQLACGDSDAVKQAFRFIRKYQRADGKIPHEVSQSAGYIDWFRDYPFAYIHPDSPLWYILSHRNFWRFTGDAEFLRESWPSIRKAYEYCLTILDPADGLPKIPKGEWGSTENAAFTKDAAMAGEWIAALRAVSELALASAEPELAQQAAEQERVASLALERAFWNPATGYYNYGFDLQGKPVTLLNPMIGYSAWFGALPEARARQVLEKLSTAAFLSDWGQRNMSLDDPAYNEGSYQTGSTWPFMTAGPMLAQYRYRNAVQGLLVWRSMLHLRGLGSLGAMPEALSGHSLRMLDRGVPHQMFSEHVAIPGLVNGIMGLDLNVPKRELEWAPQLPPSWPEATLRRFPFGRDRLNLHIRNRAGELEAKVESSTAQVIDLRFAPALPAGSRINAVVVNNVPAAFELRTHASDLQVMLRVPVRGRAEILIRYEPGIAVEIPWEPLLEGEGSRNLRVIRSSYQAGKLEMVIEGLPGRTYQVNVHARGEAARAVKLTAPQAADCVLSKSGYCRWTLVLPSREQPK